MDERKMTETLNIDLSIPLMPPQRHPYDMVFQTFFAGYLLLDGIGLCPTQHTITFWNVKNLSGMQKHKNSPTFKKKCHMHEKHRKKHINKKRNAQQQTLKTACPICFMEQQNSTKP